MGFARLVFGIATIFGLLAITPLFFLEHFLGRQFPPAITHPEYYYGFVGAVWSWQIIYLLIAWDPLRYRPLMLLGALVKGAFVLVVFALVAQGRTPWQPALLVLGDLVLAPLFVWAFVRTRDLDLGR